MGYFKKGVTGVTLLFMLSIFANLVSYFTRAVLTRTISLEEYGLFYAAYSGMMLLLIFSNMGYGSAVVKFIPEFIVKKKYGMVKYILIFTTGIRLGIAFLFSLILITLARPLTDHYFKTPLAYPVVIFFALTIIFMTAQQHLTRIFNSLHMFFSMGVIEVFQKTGFLFCILISLFFSISLSPAHISLYFLVATAVGVIVFLPLVFTRSKFFRTKTSFEPGFRSVLSRFAVSSFLIGVGYLIIGYIDTLMLTSLRGLQEVAIYNVVLPTVMLLAFFGDSVSSIFFPMVAELWAQKKNASLMQSYHFLQRYSLFFITPFVLLLLLFPKLIINLLFGAAYVQGYLAMMILSLGIVFLSVSTIRQTVLMGVGHPHTVTWIVFVGTFVNIALNLILIPVWGINGAAIATTLSYASIMVLLSVQLKKKIGLMASLLDWVKLAISSIGFIAAVYLVKSLLVMNQFVEAALCLTAASMVYLGIALALKLVSFKELWSFYEAIRSNTASKFGYSKEHSEE